MASLCELQSVQNGKTLLFRADGTVAVKTGSNAVAQGRWTTKNPSGDPSATSANQLQYDLNGQMQVPIPVQQAFNANNQLVTTIPAAANGGEASTCTWIGSIEVDDANDVVYRLMTDAQQDARHQIVVYGKLLIDDANADLVVELPDGAKTSIKRAKIPNSITTKPRDATSNKAPYQLLFSASTQNQFPDVPTRMPAPARIRFIGLWKMDPSRGFIFIAKASDTPAKPEVSIGFAGKFKGVAAGFQYTTTDNKLILTIAGQHTWDTSRGQFKFTLVNQSTALFHADFSGGFVQTFTDGRTFSLDGRLTFKEQKKTTTFALSLKGTYAFAPNGRLTFLAQVRQAGGIATYDIQLRGTIGYKNGTLTFSATLSNKQTSTLQVAFESADLKAKFSAAFGKTLEDTTFNLEFAKSWNIIGGKWVSGDTLIVEPGLRGIAPGRITAGTRDKITKVVRVRLAEPAEVKPREGIATGTVKWFNNSKGYGFVTGENGSDFFFRLKDIQGAGFGPPSTGDKVSFFLTEETTPAYPNLKMEEPLGPLQEKEKNRDQVPLHKQPPVRRKVTGIKINTIERDEISEANAGASPKSSDNASLREGDAARQEPRYVQAKVRRFQGRQLVKDPPVWIAGASHLVSVRVGPSDAGWISPKGLVAFPYKLLPKAKKHRLRVTLIEPNHLAAPLVRDITISSSGPSDVAAFRIRPLAGYTRFRASIVIAHRNRILQTALLTGRVVKNASDAALDDHIEVEIEAVVRQWLNDLDGRARFDAAFAVNQTPDGGQRLLALADEHSVVRGLSEIKDRIDAISQCLSSVANDADSYADGLASKDAVSILRFLADNGRKLYNFLIRDQVFAPKLKNGTHLQIVNLTPDAYFPAEFIYDFATPAENATLCEAAKTAFEKLDFTNVCKHQNHETPNHPVVCPFGFWGLQRVIERHAYQPVGLNQIDGAFVLQTEPMETRRSVELVGNAILGVSANVEKEQKGATAALLKKIQASSPTHVTMVATWEGWIRQIKSLRPSLIVTLPHVVEKSQFGISDFFLEIGGELQKVLTVGEPSAHYVCAGKDGPMPLVLLLGCNTTAPTRPIDSIVGDFRRGGASIVVGTVGSVLGSHASKVAQELVDALFSKTTEKARPLGELLLEVRRICVGKKVLMALCVCAFGDADWLVQAIPDPGGRHVPN